MKIGVVVNKKYNEYSYHTDSVNKITRLLLEEYEKSDVNFFIEKQKLIVHKNRFFQKVLNLFQTIKFQFKPLNYDVLHVISESELTLGSFSSKKIIVTLHGAEYFSHPDLRARSRKNLSERLSRILIRCFKNKIDLFTTVSCWAADIWRLGFGISPEKIKIIYNPINANYFEVNALNEKKRQVVFLGNTKKQKNLERVLRASEKFYHNYGYRLVLIGPNENIYEQSFITNYGVLSDDDLQKVVGESEIMIFTSLVESFGMPAIEGSLMGCKVITSKNTALPEVTMQAETYVDPYSSDSIYMGLKKAMERKFTKLDYSAYHPQRISGEYLTLYRSLL